jgi:hypothetical protein
MIKEKIFELSQLSQSYQFEQNLIDELKISNDVLEDDRINFENELLAFNSGVDLDLVINRSFTHMKKMKIIVRFTN